MSGCLSFNLDRDYKQGYYCMLKYLSPLLLTGVFAGMFTWTMDNAMHMNYVILFIPIILIAGELLVLSWRGESSGYSFFFFIMSSSKHVYALITTKKVERVIRIYFILCSLAVVLISVGFSVYLQYSTALYIVYCGLAFLLGLSLLLLRY